MKRRCRACSRRCAQKWRRHTPSRRFFGFVNAFKPVGPSSAAFGNWVRRLCDGVPVGHWGTLDPDACGVLVLAVGKATRLLPLLPDARKHYVFELRLGTKTDSGDRSGAIVQTSAVPSDWAARLGPTLAGLETIVRQIPPMHSALKVGGRPLYESARAGVEVPRSARAVRIYQLRALEEPPSHPLRQETVTSVRLYVECDAGTYVRTLCELIAAELGTAGHMGMLVRVASGNFGLADARTPVQLAHDVSAAVIDPLAVLPQPQVELDAAALRRFVNGNEVMVSGMAATEGDVLVTHAGELLGTGAALVRDGRIVLAPERVLVESRSERRAVAATAPKG